MTAEPEKLLALIKNAGAVCLGRWSPEALGDCGAGPAHILPSCGAARFMSPLSAESFLKKTSVIRYSEGDLRAVRDDMAAVSLAEGLPARAASVSARFEDGRSDAR